VRGVEGISIKSCRAVKRFYCANTIVISAPYHLAIDAAPVDKKSFNWVTASLDEFITEHPPEQYQGFLDDSYQHIKLSNPWALKTNKFVEFIWTDPTWSRSNLFDYSVLPGVVDYRYQQDAHINLFFQYLKEPR